METYQDFFNRLDANITQAQNKKALMTLDRIGRNYVNNIPHSYDLKFKARVRKRFMKSRKLIARQRKKI